MARGQQNNATTAAPAAPVYTQLEEKGDGLPATQCRACGSTKRGDYTPTREPLVHDGKVIRWLRTQCECGQIRVDRFEADAPKGKAR